MARMKYDIIFSTEAANDFRNLKARDRSIVRDTIEKHLRLEPEKLSKSRIKRLRGLSRPQYRLRVDEFRIFYDIVGSAVEILAIVPKSKTSEWLKQKGEQK